MLNFLKELWKTIAPTLKAQILVFTILVLILGLVYALTMPDFRPWILSALAVLILLALGVYLYELRLAAPKTPDDKEPPKPATIPQLPSVLPVQPPVPTPVISIEELRNAYLEQLIKECRLARLVGIRPESADPSQRAFRLDKLYQELDTKTPIKRKKEVEKKGASEQKTAPRPAARRRRGANFSFRDAE